MGECVVCTRKISSSLEFCQLHYKTYKKDILDKKPWVRVLRNDAQRERRRRDREAGDRSLDEIQEKYNERRWE